MSRVKKPNKWVNGAVYEPSITNISKKKRIHAENEDYRKAKTLSAWLFMKYDMQYKAYRRKSAKRRQELRDEYAHDTGNDTK